MAQRAENNKRGEVVVFAACMRGAAKFVAWRAQIVELVFAPLAFNIQLHRILWCYLFG